ncbi:MAG TPA: hypothetical protein VG942_11065 [Hyphomonadaceae bacterium]|nr:hypothetical protein [Hyphomonadaceae bacterium]
MIRTVFLLCLVGLSACAPPQGQGAVVKKEQPDCCAIAPRAKCRSELLSAGATQEEAELLLGPPERICPTQGMSEARLRHVASLRGQACKAVLDYDVLAMINAGQCSKPGS